MNSDTIVMEREQGLMILDMGEGIRAIPENGVRSFLLRRLFSVIAYLPEPSKHGRWSRQDSENIADALREIHEDFLIFDKHKLHDE